MTDEVRSCGGCSACCEGWLSDKSMNLKVGSPCPNITAHGCGIYDTRPEKPCRSFTCAWLQRPEQFPESLRPDRSGAICILDRDWYDWKVLRAIPVGEKVPKETFDWLLNHAKNEGIPFIFLEYEIDDGKMKSSSMNALGPVAFAEEVKARPGQDDLFWGLGE